MGPPSLPPSQPCGETEELAPWGPRSAAPWGPDGRRDPPEASCPSVWFT